MAKAFEGPAEMYYNDKKLKPGTPEATELAQKILTTLAELWYAKNGYELGSIEFGKRT